MLDSYLVAPTLLPVPTDADSVIDRIAELVGTGFDVTVHPPLRAELFHIDDRTHLLALIIHHIAADAWSMDVLIRDALTAYSTRAAGTAPTWTPLPIRYIDYSIWQRDSGVPDHVTEYWLRNLADLPEQVTLPLDHPRPLTASGRGRSHHVDIDDDLHTMIGALARNHRATTFMVMHAALAVLLSRYTRQLRRPDRDGVRRSIRPAARRPRGNVRRNIGPTNRSRPNSLVRPISSATFTSKTSPPTPTQTCLSRRWSNF